MPPRCSSLPRCLAALLRGHLRGASLTPLEPALATESNSRRVFPFVRIKGRLFAGRFIHDLPCELIHVTRALP
jgi:hypothetical protein